MKDINDPVMDSMLRVKRQAFPGMVVSHVQQGSFQEFFISAWPRTGEVAQDVFERVARVLNDLEVVVVSQEVFGFNSHTGGWTALQEALGEISWPVTWLEDSPGSPCAGVEIWAVKATNIHPVLADGTIIGSIFENGESRICRLGGLLPPGLTASPSDQTRAIFDLMEQGLGMVGMDFSNVIRTWFHNRDILSWYQDFNKERTRFFVERGVFQRLVPASTGVSGINPRGAALTAGLLAIDALTPIPVEALPSPLQCPALDYGSSFSRAVAVHYPDHQRVYISGTASIDAQGRIAHHGDLVRQIHLTLDVIHSILGERNLSWKDAVRAIAYVKHPGHYEIAQEVLKSSGLSGFPLIFTQTDLCYEDLLFEMELDAIGPLRNPGS